MGKSLRNKSLAVAVSLALASSGALLVADTAHADPHARQAASAAVSEVHIITFAEAGLLHYAGDVAGYQGTAPRALWCTRPGMTWSGRYMREGNSLCGRIRSCASRWRM